MTGIEQLYDMLKRIQEPKGYYFNRDRERVDDLPLLIEADGSRRLPLKAPAEHEPVVVEPVQVSPGKNTTVASSSQSGQVQATITIDTDANVAEESGSDREAFYVTTTILELPGRQTLSGLALLTPGVVANVVRPGSDFAGNVVVGDNGNPIPKNLYAASFNDVGLLGGAAGLTDLNAPLGNLTLSAASPFKGKATDGADPGADIARIIAATAARKGPRSRR